MRRAGIVGLGRWGRRLVDSVQGSDVAPSRDLRFTRAHTRTQSKAAEYTARLRLQAAPSYEDLLADPEIDVVVLATPHSGHPREIALAVAARRPAFCEKPLALTRADAARAVASCKAAGISFALGHNRRFLPAYAELRRLIDAGSLGTLLHVEGNFSGSFGLEYDSTAWRADRRETPAGGLTLMDIHVLDAMIGLARADRLGGGHGSSTGAQDRARRHLGGYAAVRERAERLRQHGCRCLARKAHA